MLDWHSCQMCYPLEIKLLFIIIIIIIGDGEYFHCLRVLH